MKRRITPVFPPDFKPCDLDGQIETLEIELYFFEAAVKAGKIYENVIPPRRHGLRSAIHTLKQLKERQQGTLAMGVPSATA